MATIKPGDKVMVGPWYSKSHTSTWSATVNPGTMDAIFVDGLLEGNVHPWHPALPAIADLLAEHGPALAAAVERITDLAEQGLDNSDPAHHSDWLKHDLMCQLAAVLKGTGDGKETN